jgi:hypothetical protein
VKQAASKTFIQKQRNTEVRQRSILWNDILTSIDNSIKILVSPLIPLIAIQSVNKYMLQGSVADRGVQSDHILLIHQCPETLPFALKLTKFPRGCISSRGCYRCFTL